MELRDSRRLTGPNLISGGPGAVVDIAAGDRDRELVIEAWGKHARDVLEGLGLEPCLHVRRFRGGASLVMEAPVDALYGFCQINEWALEAAMADASGASAPDLAPAVSSLRKTLEAERNPALL